jgi:hypothetical protein
LFIETKMNDLAKANYVFVLFHPPAKAGGNSTKAGGNSAKVGANQVKVGSDLFPHIPH